MTSVYIHIPFCERVCFYCDFPKKVSKTTEINAYLDALLEEVKMYHPQEKIETIYLGGGTPSILNQAQFDKLAKVIALFNKTDNYEFTIECNPEHVNQRLVENLHRLGINRISLGVQTFNESLLKILNRKHSCDMVYRVVDLLKKANFHNINIDLMFAIPGQTLDDLKQDLRYIKALNIPHISYYSLILEDKTVFNQLVNDEKLILIENDLEAKMYEIVIETLKRNNYQHYEISNFAKKNYQSRHNLVYWNNKHYYGFGMGASGYLNNIRYYNSNHVNHYLQLVNNHQFPVIKKDILNKNEQLKEAFLLGLRLIDGLSINELNKTYNIDVREYFQKELSYLVNNNWIEISERIKLTHQGLFYGNEVFEKFL